MTDTSKLVEDYRQAKRYLEQCKERAVPDLVWLYVGGSGRPASEAIPDLSRFLYTYVRTRTHCVTSLHVIELYACAHTFEQGIRWDWELYQNRSPGESNVRYTAVTEPQLEFQHRVASQLGTEEQLAIVSCNYSNQLQFLCIAQTWCEVKLLYTIIIARTIAIASYRCLFFIEMCQENLDVLANIA